jgi:hypothetical protein
VIPGECGPAKPSIASATSREADVLRDPGGEVHGVTDDVLVAE